MPIIGVTGGIATGKSTFTRALLRRLPAEVFDADRAAGALLENDPDVRSSIIAEFGAEAFDPGGRPNRRWLRELIFADERNRKRLEAILHPVIRLQWTSRAKSARVSREWLVVDIPLLYETGAETECDRVVVVACSRPTQQLRLQTVRGLDPDIADRIIFAQLDLETKIKRADHLIWNDSTTSSLEAQAELLAAWLRQKYG